METAFHLTGVPITTLPKRVEALVSEAQTPSPTSKRDFAASPDDSRAQAEIRPAPCAFADRPGVETYANWDQQAVSTFVTTSCDLPQYEGTIKANNITGSQLRELRRHDILNIGLIRAGICDHDHQRRISNEMLRVEQGHPESEHQRLSQTAKNWQDHRKVLQRQHRNADPVLPRANWDKKRRELSFGRLTTCYMPGNKEGRFMYGPRLDLTRTAKLMRREATVPAELFSSETRKTMQPYDPQRHSKMAGAAASSRGLVKILGQ